MAMGMTTSMVLRMRGRGGRTRQEDIRSIFVLRLPVVERAEAFTA
jgi:hypothetical protein